MTPLIIDSVDGDGNDNFNPAVVLPDAQQQQEHLHNGPNISRELKPGRNRFGPKSATMAVFHGGEGGRNRNPLIGNSSHFNTLASGRALTSAGPPVPRALKPKNTG